MKPNIRILFLLFLAAALISCEKVKNSSVEVIPGTYYFPYEGGTVSLSIESNASWNATCEDKSLSIEPSSGVGASTVRVTAPENKEKQTILYKVDIKAKNSKDSTSTKFLVTQAAAPFVEASKNVINIPASGGGVQIEIEANSPWYVSSADPGVTVSPSEGTTNASVNISVGENTLDAERQFNIVFSLKDYKTDDEVVVVKQTK